MPFSITAAIECFLLPDDGATARATFLEHLEDPYEMWIIAYSFTLEPMIDEIIANNTAGAPIHIYLDFSQSSGHAEAAQLQKLIHGGVEVTIGTSPVGTQYICHTKGIVCDHTPEPWCWEGSVNFSESGWSQVNTALLFNSTDYRNAFVNQFEHLRYFAWTQERSKQLMSEPPAGALTPPADIPVPAKPAARATPPATHAPPKHKPKRAPSHKKNGDAKKKGAKKA
jgi:hypothetical protein